MFQQLADAFAPHVRTLLEAINGRLQGIEHLLEHSNRVSDLGKPDSDDIFARIVRKGKFKKGGIGGNLIEGVLLGRPKIGEYWLIQAIISNGAGVKTPNFVMRTNAGALIATVLKETNSTILLNGTVALLPGEELELEPEAEGEFDITVHLIRRKIPQHVPDAAGSVAQGDGLDWRSPSSRYELDRYLPDSPDSEWRGVDVPATIEGNNQQQYGGLTPEVAVPAFDANTAGQFDEE